MGWKELVGVEFDGIGAAEITLKSAAGLLAIDEGSVGKISADKTIGLCAAEEIFYGVINKVDLGGVSAVQHKGFRTVAFTGAPVLGYQELVANGADGVKPPSPGVKASLVTGAVVDNNAIRFTAVKYGAGEEDISIKLLDPAGNDKALSVDVVGRDIIISLATGPAVASTALDGGVNPTVGRKVFVVSKDAAAGTLVIDLG